MAIFNDNLTPEEIQSGFSTEEADGEVFSLNAFGGKYPGKIPDYNKPTFLEISNDTVNEENTVNEEDIFSEEVPVNEEDIFNEEQEDNSDIEEAEITISDIPERAETDEIQDISLDNVFDILNEEDNVTEEDNNDIEEAEVIINEDVDAENTDAENIEKVEEIEKVKIALDDDFLQMLSEDIKRDNSKQTAKDENYEQEVSEQVADDVVRFNTPIETDISGGTETVMADLITMEIETTKAEFENENNFENEDLSKNIPNVADKEFYTNENKTTETMEQENNKNNKESKDKKKTTILIIAIVGLASLLIIGIVIGFLYISTPKNKKETTQTTDTAETKIPELEIIEEETIEITQDTTHIEDTVKIIEEPKKPEVVERSPIVHPEQPAVPVQQPRPTPERKTQPQPQPQQQKKAVEAVYTVQIYSSPSRADAESRLNLLKQKNIDGVISTQQIKGNTWYRVRFGSYSSYEEALSAASRLGFSDAWIERVR